MAASDEKLPAQDVLRTEAQAERERAHLVAESRDRLKNRCPECGALGSLEEHGGELKCIDCDLTVGAVTKLAGFGRR